MAKRGARVLAKKVSSGDFTILGCESVHGRVQQALPLPWSPQERREIEAISAASIPALTMAVLAVAAAAARKRQREDMAASAMDGVKHEDVHGGSVESRRAAFVVELRGRLSAALPLDKETEQKMPVLAPEVRMQATSDMIESLGLGLLPVSKRAAPAKASRVQTVAVLQRTFGTSDALDSLFGARWYIEYSGRLMLIFCPPIHVEVVRTTVESRRCSFVTGSHGGYYTDMEVLSSTTFVELRVRLRYVTLFHDLLSAEAEQMYLDLYTKSQPRSERVGKDSGPA